MMVSPTGVERRLLVRVLEAEIRDVRTAVHHARTHDVRAFYRGQEAAARRLLERLRGEPALVA